MLLSSFLAAQQAYHFCISCIQKADAYISICKHTYCFTCGCTVDCHDGRALSHGPNGIYLFFYLALLPAVAFFWWLHQRRKEPVTTYFLAGAWILFLTGIISFHAAILSDAPMPSYGMHIFSLKLLMIGSVCALVCFLMSIVHHVRRAQTETIIRQQGLIQQMSREMQKLTDDLQCFEKPLPRTVNNWKLYQRN